MRHPESLLRPRKRAPQREDPDVDPCRRRNIHDPFTSNHVCALERHWEYEKAWGFGRNGKGVGGECWERSRLVGEGIERGRGEVPCWGKFKCCGYYGFIKYVLCSPSSFHVSSPLSTLQFEYGETRTDENKKASSSSSPVISVPDGKSPNGRRSSNGLGIVRRRRVGRRRLRRLGIVCELGSHVAWGGCLYSSFLAPV